MYTTLPFIPTRRRRYRRRYHRQYGILCRLRRRFTPRLTPLSSEGADTQQEEERRKRQEEVTPEVSPSIPSIDPDTLQGVSSLFRRSTYDATQVVRLGRALYNCAEISSEFTRLSTCMDGQEQIQVQSAAIPQTADGLLSSAYLSSTSDQVPTIVDSGASVTVTPFLSDFVGTLQPPPFEELSGLQYNTPVVGIGLIELEVFDLHGTVAKIRTLACFVPDAQVRLYSPQTHFQKSGMKGSLLLTAYGARLVTPDDAELHFPFADGSNLPFMLEHTNRVPTDDTIGIDSADVDVLSDPHSMVTVLDERNQNLTASEKELLLQHHKLGHAGFDRIQALGRPPSQGGQPVLHTKETGFTSVKPPKCAACLLGKQSKRSSPTRHIKAPHDMHLKVDAMNPGDILFLDHYDSAIRGRLPDTFGKESEKQRYGGGLIGVDAASGYIFHAHQVGTTAGETVQSLKKFRREAQDMAGISTFRRVHADNHPFRADHIRSYVQGDLKATMHFSGVGAHHQNGTAERAIGTVTRWARTLMLKDLIDWPETADLALWPFALSYAIYLWNHMPKDNNSLAPIELFSRVKLPEYTSLQRAHVWGCPTYVLDARLQDSKKIPKWEPRSRRGKFLGFSTEHSSTVGLILNLSTGSVSPQWHVVFDDTYSTVHSVDSQEPVEFESFSVATWNKLVESGCERFAEASEDQHGNIIPLPHLDPEWNPERVTPPTVAPLDPPLPAPDPAVPTPTTPTVEPVSVSEGDELQLETDEFQLETVPEEPVPFEEPPTPRSPVRRVSPRRVRNKPMRLTKDTMNGPWVHVSRAQSQKLQYSVLERQRAQTLDWSWSTLTAALKSSSLRQLNTLLDLNTDPVSETVESFPPGLFGAKIQDESTPNYFEAMNGPDREGFMKAMDIEVDTLTNVMKAWDVVPRESHMNVLPGTWSFKRKRRPDGTIYKLKARFCVRGDKQKENIDFFADDIFAPVVHWNTVRLMLIFASLLDLKSKQVDYLAAFLHAPITDDVYVQMPKGYEQPGMVLKLNKSLYGLKQSPRNFFAYQKEHLEACGCMSCPDIDPCLFISDKVIVLSYVDDSIFFAKDEKDIDDLIAKLRARKVEVEVEDQDVAGYLGVKVHKNLKDGSVKLSQPGLLKRILEALDLGDQPITETPAVPNVALGSDPDGPGPQGTFSYASVVGMLQYLQAHSRPDIAFAVSQCARHVHSPKRSHEVALEYIGRYLKGTSDEGLILKPDRDRLFQIDCYVDADFSGMWGHESPHDPTSVKSRTGMVICVANCPVIFSSKLQALISTSTTEAEYTAMSDTCRELLPFRELVKTLGHGLGLSQEVKSTFHTTIHEDNLAALKVAHLAPGQFTPRTKFYGIKVHWFRQHLGPDFTVEYIETKKQRADIMTKSLAATDFKNIRYLLSGW